MYNPFEYVIGCNATEIYSCYGNSSNDCAGAILDSGTNKPTLMLNGVEVNLRAYKNTFKQGRTRNFRTEKEKIFEFLADPVPESMIGDIDEIFSRGEVYVDGVRYLVSETNFQLIDECFKIWLPSATFHEKCSISFGCEADPCAPPITDCCDPTFTGIIVTEVAGESGFPDESGSGGPGGVFSGIVVVQAVVDSLPNVTGTFDSVTGIVNGSTVVSCAAFANARVFVERGNIQIPGIDPLDGSQYYTKVFADPFITFSVELVTGEFIYIETIPS